MSHYKPTYCILVQLMILLIANGCSATKGVNPNTPLQASVSVQGWPRAYRFDFYSGSTIGIKMGGIGIAHKHMFKRVSDFDFNIIMLSVRDAYHEATNAPKQAEVFDGITLLISLDNTRTHLINA